MRQHQGDIACIIFCMPSLFRQLMRIWRHRGCRSVLAFDVSMNESAMLWYNKIFLVEHISSLV